MKLKSVIFSGAAIAVAAGLTFGGFALADQSSYVAPPVTTPAPAPTETVVPEPTTLPVEPTPVEPTPVAPDPGAIAPPPGQGKAPVSTAPVTPPEPAAPRIVDDPAIAPPPVYNQITPPTP